MHEIPTDFYNAKWNNPPTANSEIYLYTDSLTFYYFWQLGKQEFVDFDSYSCIYFSKTIESPKNLYIDHVSFTLEENNSNYVLVGKFCTRKVFSNRKRIKEFNHLIKTKKLANKPITLEFRYD